MTGEELVGLVPAMIDAFIEGGKIKPVLPRGQRDRVVSVLNYMMADLEALDRYCDVLIALTKAEDALWHEVPRFELGMQIAREGFGGLSDDEVAAFAISPLALCLIDKYLHRPDTGVGDWLLREEAAYTEACKASGIRGLRI